MPWISRISLFDWIWKKYPYLHHGILLDKPFIAWTETAHHNNRSQQTQSENGWLHLKQKTNRFNVKHPRLRLEISVKAPKKKTKRGILGRWDYFASRTSFWLMAYSIKVILNSLWLISVRMIFRNLACC